MNERELAKQYPEAFAALPEPYQNDSCLVFWLDNDEIWAAPLEEQADILGCWMAVFSPINREWKLL